MEYGQRSTPVWRRQWVRKLALASLGSVLTAQATTAGVLEVASIIRRHQRPQPDAPRHDNPPGRIGDSAFKLYGQGQALYDDMIAAIAGARETVWFETYIWKGDELSQRFLAAMLERARAGVDVRFIYDHFGNLVVPAAKKAFPEPIKTYVHRGLTRPWQVLDPRHYALEHRKVLVIDGRTVFTGGFNIGGDYARKWRDTHIRVEGPSVTNLALSFADFWNAHVSDGELAAPRRYAAMFDPLIQVQVNDAATLSFPIRDMYLRALDMAERSIRLTSAYFAPDQAMAGELIDAARRGVDVQILVPWVSNHVVMDWLARGYFDELLDAGARIFGYEGMIHAKTCTVDGIWSTVGTANLDRLSQWGNHELNLDIISEDLARQLEDMFERDVQSAREIRRDEWKRRPFYARFAELTLEPLRNLM